MPIVITNDILIVLIVYMIVFRYMRNNFLHAMQNKKAIVAWILVLILMIAFQYWQFDFQLVEGNLGLSFARAEVILYGVITILFTSFVILQTHKILAFSKTPKPKSLGGWFGGLLWILTVGCPACSITIASFIGLSAFFLALPFKWLEVKILAIILLIRTNYRMLKDLTTCKRK